jgi:hypothetical protein
LLRAARFDALQAVGVSAGIAKKHAQHDVVVESSKDTAL